MADISVECTGADAAQVTRHRKDASDSVYIAAGESAALDDAYLAQVSVAEEGAPALKLVNGSGQLRLEVFSVRDGRATRGRPLMPQRSRAVVLRAGERLLLIPATPEVVPTRSKRQ